MNFPFNAAILKVLAQGKKSTIDMSHPKISGGQSTPLVTCAYRTEDPNVRCGVGHMIPNSRYTEDMEGLDAGHLVVFNVLPDEVKWYGRAVIKKFQGCHDLVGVYEDVHYERWNERTMFHMAYVRHLYDANIPGIDAIEGEMAAWVAANPLYEGEL